MAVEPFDWNIVSVGYWNLAILTPRGIAIRLFELEEGTPITVEVPMDGLAPHRISHEGIIITPEHGRLTLAAETPTLRNLEQAKQIAVKAITKLPETPFTAVGINLKFKIDDPPDRLLKAIETSWDRTLSDDGFTIKSRRTRRSIEYGAGVLNLDIISGDNAETTIGFNFHRQSSIAPELCEWLSTSCDDLKTICSTIIKSITGLEFEEVWNNE